MPGRWSAGAERGTGNMIYNSRVTAGPSGCNSGILVSGDLTMVGVQVDSNNCVGVFAGAAGSFYCYGSVSAKNVGASSPGFEISQNSNGHIALFLGCLAYSNGAPGFQFDQLQGVGYGIFMNNIAWNNTGGSISVPVGTTNYGADFDYNAYASATLVNLPAGPHDVILSADPTVNGASLNFSLNNTSGGGLAIKAKAFPTTLFGSTGFNSIGPLQPLVNSGASLGGGAFGFVQ